MEDDGPSVSIDLELPERIRIGATRGEFNTHIGQPRDYPDSVDVTVSESDEGTVLFTVDATAGDHGTGHADVEFTLAEAEQLRDALDRTIERVSDS